MAATSSSKPAEQPTTEFQDGSLFVVETECKFSSDRSHGTIVIQSRNPDHPRAIDELGAAAARNLALGFAASRGVPDPRVNGNNIGPYPINKNKTPLDKVAEEAGKPLNPRDPLMQPVAYRVEVPVCRKLV